MLFYFHQLFSNRKSRLNESKKHVTGEKKTCSNMIYSIPVSHKTNNFRTCYASYLLSFGRFLDCVINMWGLWLHKRVIAGRLIWKHVLICHAAPWGGKYNSIGQLLGYVILEDIIVISCCGWVWYTSYGLALAE